MNVSRLVVVVSAVALFLTLFLSADEQAAAEKCDDTFLDIVPEAPTCGFTLSDAGTLTWENQVLADPLVASYEMSGEDGTPIPAGKVVLFPASPDGRFRIVQACEGPEPTALCWSVFVLDHEAQRLHESYAGKYGPERWQSWSPDGRYVALVSTTEAVWWLHVVEAENGETHDFPDDTLEENWFARPDGVTWTGPRALTATVTRCKGCTPAKQQIRF